MAERHSHLNYTCGMLPRSAPQVLIYICSPAVNEDCRNAVTARFAHRMSRYNDVTARFARRMAILSSTLYHKKARR